MTFGRIASAIALMAIVGLLASSPGSVTAQAKKDKEKDKGVDKETLDSFMKLVEEAAKNKDYREDKTHGNGSTGYEDAPAKPGVLIGLDLWAGLKDKTTTYVRGVRPIFLNNEGKKPLGSIHGWVANVSPATFMAKPGYAVGGVKIHTDFGVIAGMAVVFYKITATGLDPNDSYESKYVGYKDPTTAKLIGGTGEPIVGIHGLVADNPKSHDLGFGLTILGKDPKKK
jgi:hypothetical protein